MTWLEGVSEQALSVECAASEVTAGPRSSTPCYLRQPYPAPGSQTLDSVLATSTTVLVPQVAMTSGRGLLLQAPMFATARLKAPMVPTPINQPPPPDHPVDPGDEGCDICHTHYD